MTVVDPLAGLPLNVQRMLRGLGPAQAAPAPIHGGHLLDSAPLAPVIPISRAASVAFVGHDPLATQLPGERFALNTQQQAIMQAVVGQGRNVIVRAKAGTGKTSTLEALARRLEIARPDGRIIYIAFNKSVQIEAGYRMPDNVEARTGHSLSWNAVGAHFTGKLPGDRRQLRAVDPSLAASDEVKYLRSRPRAIAKALGVSLLEAETVVQIVETYANSADEELGLEHVVRVLDQLDQDAAADAMLHGPGRLFDAARTYWDDIATPLGSGGRGCRFAATQDHLRKLWALTKPDFTNPPPGLHQPAQILFLDEAQDTPPVLAAVIEAQAMQKVLVGDSQQAIYGFSGATDYLDEVDTDDFAELSLTTSYRFGSNIARVANRFLGVLDSPDMVQGIGSADHVGLVLEPDAVLTRTNVGMIEEAMQEAARGRRVGLLDKAYDELRQLIVTTAHLRDGAAKPAAGDRHPALGRFDTWSEACAEAKRDPSGSVSVAMQMVRRWSLSMMTQLLEKATRMNDSRPQVSGCEVVVVTVHKAKGLEWDAVRIGGDFAGPTSKVTSEPFDSPERMRLNYVAVTRARLRLDLGSLSWIQTYRP